MAFKIVAVRDAETVEETKVSPVIAVANARAKVSQG